MTRKVALFAFNGDPNCIVHVLLNALDMKEKGYDVRLVIEGGATYQLESLNDTSHPLNGLYQKVKDAGLIECVCKACANKMGTLESAMEQDLPVCGEMMGHPGISRYLEDGYEVLIF